MKQRSKDWNEGLAGDLEDPAFAREFVRAAVEEGIPLEVARAKLGAQIEEAKTTLEAVDDEFAMTPEEEARLNDALDEGEADIAAGRVHTIDEIITDLNAEYRAADSESMNAEDEERLNDDLDAGEIEIAVGKLHSLEEVMAGFKSRRS